MVRSRRSGLALFLSLAVVACARREGPAGAARASVTSPPFPERKRDAGAQGAAGAPDASAERSVLVVSIDGLRREALDDAALSIPTLRKLAAEGAMARSLASVWPSSTYPAHTTMVTGLPPARHGIVNNLVFDPLGESAGAWFWYARDIRVATLWDVAREANLDVANVTWPVTVGANIRWNVPQYWRTKTAEDEKLICALSTPGLCDELRAAGVRVPGEHLSDRERALAAAFLVRTKKPRLTFAYLTDLDSTQHEHGPLSPHAKATLERTDGLLSTLVTAATESLPRVAIVVVSDHGFVSVDREVRPNVALRRAGLLDVKNEGREVRVLGYRAYSWRAGGSAAIMGDPSVKAQVRALFEELAQKPENGIAEVLDGAAVEREGGFPGALVVLQASEGVIFNERVEEPMVAATKYKGGHGHAPKRAGLAAALVLAGHGVRKGAELGDVAMVDVAPTIAALLGIAIPSAGGRPLKEILSEP